MAYKTGLNPFEVIHLANKHPRVSLLNPSCGVGGHCIAVDPWFLIETFSAETSLLKAARAVNDQKPLQVLSIIKNTIREWQKIHQKRCCVTLLGITYKANTDDIRESPALFIAQEMAKESTVDTYVYDPHIDPSAISTLTNAHAMTTERFLEKADIIVGLVNHTLFKNIARTDFTLKTILDFCGIWYEPTLKNEQEHFLSWPHYTHSIAPIIKHIQQDTM
jgi:UDP-N-acetyl-D-mannosaminuronic acid dehydrogenase